MFAATLVRIRKSHDNTKGLFLMRLATRRQHVPTSSKRQYIVLNSSAGRSLLFFVCATATCTSYFIFAPAHHRAVISDKIFSPSQQRHRGTASFNSSATDPSTVPNYAKLCPTKTTCTSSITQSRCQHPSLTSNLVFLCFKL